MKKKKFLDVVLDILLTAGIVCCAFLISLKIFCVRVIVSGSSMNPSITNGDAGYMYKVKENTRKVVPWYNTYIEWRVKRPVFAENYADLRVVLM